MLIALDDIQENGNMRRTSHCTTANAALEASIAALGVLQPILVRPDPNGGYVLIAGYRRVAAARRVGLAECLPKSGLWASWKAKRHKPRKTWCVCRLILWTCGGTLIS